MKRGQLLSRDQQGGAVWPRTRGATALVLQEGETSDTMRPIRSARSMGSSAATTREKGVSTCVDEGKGDMDSAAALSSCCEVDGAALRWRGEMPM